MSFDQSNVWRSSYAAPPCPTVSMDAIITQEFNMPGSEPSSPIFLESTSMDDHEIYHSQEEPVNYLNHTPRSFSVPAQNLENQHYVQSSQLSAQDFEDNHFALSLPTAQNFPNYHYVLPSQPSTEGHHPLQAPEPSAHNFENYHYAPSSQPLLVEAYPSYQHGFEHSRASMTQTNQPLRPPMEGSYLSYQHDVQHSPANVTQENQPSQTPMLDLYHSYHFSGHHGAQQSQASVVQDAVFNPLSVPQMTHQATWPTSPATLHNRNISNVSSDQFYNSFGPARSMGNLNPPASGSSTQEFSTNHGQFNYQFSGFNASMPLGYPQPFDLTPMAHNTFPLPNAAFSSRSHGAQAFAQPINSTTAASSDGQDLLNTSTDNDMHGFEDLSHQVSVSGPDTNMFPPEAVPAASSFSSSQFSQPLREPVLSPFSWRKEPSPITPSFPSRTEASPRQSLIVKLPNKRNPKHPSQIVKLSMKKKTMAQTSCPCGQPDDTYMVECMGSGHVGPRNFHLQCVELKKRPLEQWFCDKCNYEDFYNTPIFSNSSAEGLRFNVPLPFTIPATQIKAPRLTKPTPEVVPELSLQTRIRYTPKKALHIPTKARDPINKTKPAPKIIAESRKAVVAKRNSAQLAAKRAAGARASAAKATAWSENEDRACMKLMPEVKTAGACKRIDDLWEMVSKRLLSDYGFHRSPAAVKNQWNRVLRAKCGFDERATKKPHSLRTGLLPSAKAARNM